MWDRENKQALPDTGLAFTGSYYYQDFAGERKLAADTLDTRGIAATYNDPESLLTVPWQASQGDVYGQYIPHPDRRPPDYTPLTLTLQPLDGGKARLIELKLSITADPQGRLHFALTDAQGRRLNADTGVAGFTRAAAELVEQRRDPFVTVTPGDGVTIAQMKEAADLLGSIDKFTGIRVEPPAEGHLFYRAFTPEPKWRQRDERLFHGWEVHIDTGAGRQPTATLYDVTDDRDADGLTIIRETKYQPDTPAALAKIIEDADGARPRDIYVFIDGTATYGTLRRTLADVIDTHNVVLVYTNR